MKQLVFILLYLLTSAICFAQKIRFTDTSNKWNIKYINSNFTNWQYTSYEYSSFDLTINGLNYHLLDSYYIREDTVLQKVFARNANTSTCDTTEFILYDYTLAVGDTLSLHCCNHDYSTVVTDLDTVIINGTYHRLWKMACAASPLFPGYTVIEGIGSTLGPTIHSRPEYEGAILLYCFENKGIIPPITGNAGVLNNTTSCTLGIPFISNNNKPLLIYPNPVNTISRVSFPVTIYEGLLTIHDVIGRTLYSSEFRRRDEFQIGEINLKPGMYFIWVKDLIKNESFVGRFLKL